LQVSEELRAVDETVIARQLDQHRQHDAGNLGPQERVFGLIVRVEGRTADAGLACDVADPDSTVGAPADECDKCCGDQRAASLDPWIKRLRDTLRFVFRSRQIGAAPTCHAGAWHEYFDS
jgi:hypothetical protein